jgi:hypothetical protein
MQANLAAFTFGAELEVLVPFGFNRETTATELTRRAGITVDSRSVYGSSTNWKIVSDGSVSGPGVPLEIVSPVLSGQTGLDQVAAIANALAAMGATVNSTCGYHVHVGARGEQLGFFKNLVKLYGRFEDALDSMMPASRRGNDATYCKSVKLVAPTAIEQARSIPELSSAIARASRAAGSRYHKVNLDAHSKHGTVEFRQHSGTVDASKAVNWIITCLSLVAAAKAGRLGDGAVIAIDHAAFELKTRAVLEMCSRAEGASTREICERFGFSKISVKRQARLAGVSYTETRGRFYVTATRPAPGSTAVAPTLDGLADLIEASPEHRAYLAARRAAVRS